MHTDLLSIVDRAVPLLGAIAETDAAQKPAANRWSKKEILGHLVDSAANNHQRFVRLQLEPELRLPGYEQDGWVRVNDYQTSAWADVIGLWAAYNRHLARLIASIDASALGHVWHSPDGPLTLEYIAVDYVRHLRHHLRQIGLEP